MLFFRLRPPRALRIALPLLVVVLFPTLSLVTHSLWAQTSAPKSVPQDEWVGIYLDRQKIGYSSTHYSATSYRGKPGIAATTHGVTKMQLLGREVEQEEDTQTISIQDRPLTQTFHIKSNGSVIQVQAVFDYDRRSVHCVIGQGSAATAKDLSIPVGARLESDSNNLIEGQKIAVGQKFVATFLEPLSVELQEAKVEVVEQTVVRADSGRQVPAFRIRTTMALGQMTSWVDAEGHAIQTEINLGRLNMVMVAETKARALNPAAISPALTAAPAPSGKSYVPPADFAVATAITTAKPILDPRSLRSLKVVIDGIPDEKLILSDARQQESILPSHPVAPYEVAVNITVENVDEAGVPALPTNDPALASYLKAAPYLPVDDPKLRKTASEIRGTETNPYRIATNLRDWVHNAMTPDPTIGVPRSALDIFQRRRGVCRDYATLYAALARAAGIPTRLCSGIVYGDFQGKAGFYYHAWAESWVGKWVAIDPTLFDPSHPVNYVDATHIKFAQGNVTQMFQVVSIVGRLKITVE